MPWINLRGYWLQQAGFTIGTPYTITIRQGCLVLKLEQPVTPPTMASDIIIPASSG